jgi:hypothetical protein
MDTVPESNLQALRVMKQATGLTMRVTPYEVVTRIKQVTETTIVVQLRVYQAEERRTEVILKNQGTRLVQYSLTDHGWAQAGPTVTAWDDDFHRSTRACTAPARRSRSGIAPALLRPNATVPALTATHSIRPTVRLPTMGSIPPQEW